MRYGKEIGQLKGRITKYTLTHSDLFGKPNKTPMEIKKMNKAKRMIRELTPKLKKYEALERGLHSRHKKSHGIEAALLQYMLKNPVVNIGSLVEIFGEHVEKSCIVLENKGAIKRIGKNLWERVEAKM